MVLKIESNVTLITSLQSKTPLKWPWLVHKSSKKWFETKRHLVPYSSIIGHPIFLLHLQCSYENWTIYQHDLPSEVTIVTESLATKAQEPTSEKHIQLQVKNNQWVFFGPRINKKNKNSSTMYRALRCACSKLFPPFSFPFFFNFNVFAICNKTWSLLLSAPISNTSLSQSWLYTQCTFYSHVLAKCCILPPHVYFFHPYSFNLFLVCNPPPIRVLHLCLRKSDYWLLDPLNCCLILLHLSSISSHACGFLGCLLIVVSGNISGTWYCIM